MDLVLKVLLCVFTVLNLFVTLIQPVPSLAGRCCHDGEKGERGEPGRTGQKGDKGEKGARGLPGTCSQQMVENINLTPNLPEMERISSRSRTDNSDREDGVRTALSSLFGACLDDMMVLFTGEGDDLSASRFALVKGEKGEKGDRGQSIMGEMGLPGEPGPIGPQGIKGERGELGDMGSKGDKGEKGCMGPMGLEGNTGNRGPVGPAGPAGLPGPQGARGLTGQTGLVYIRWGEWQCPLGAVQLYDGIIVQAASQFTNLLCIPKNSTSSNPQPHTSNTPPTSHITRLEPLVYTNQMGMTDAIPCVHCYVSTQSAVLTFPGRTTCPGDWSRQYSGHLMTSNEISTTDVVCADEKLSSQIQWRDNCTGAIVRNGVNMLETVCGEGAASCQGYKAGQLMPCVVCSN